MADGGADEIKAGDIVQLKSGGPRMTVNWAEDDYGTKKANCDWFVQDKAPWRKENGSFPVTSLRKLDD
jgi:uncharacterized protein YodC (DUF2158 family)